VGLAGLALKLDARRRDDPGCVSGYAVGVPINRERPLLIAIVERPFVVVTQPPVDLTLHGCAIGNGRDQPSGVSSERSLCASLRAHVPLLFNFCPALSGALRKSVHCLRFASAIETLLLSYPEGYPPVLCSARFGRIVRHRLFLAVAFSTEPLARDTKADQLLSHAVGSVLRQPEIGCLITRICASLSALQVSCVHRGLLLILVG
jgi:hypothetical protein